MEPVIIYPPTIDWNYLHQRPQQMLKALARLGCNCFFCNINIHKRYPEGYIHISPNLILSNNQGLHATIKRAREMHPHQPIVIYFTYPPHINQLPISDLMIFDSVDEPLDEFADWLPDYRNAVLHTDIVIASSNSLVDRIQALDKLAYLIPNGCDYEHFSIAQKPQKIDTVPFNQPKPIIGYIGAIAPWVDMQLVNTMARNLPKYEFVIIGPLLKQNGLALLNKNMHYLGHKDYSVLPHYLSNFGYCLIPFKVTKMTKGVNPIKLWEYLASGIPIISTPLPEVPREYVTLVTEDMFPGFSPTSGEEGKADRISFARENSWKSRATKLLHAILEKLACG